MLTFSPGSRVQRALLTGAWLFAWTLLYLAIARHLLPIVTTMEHEIFGIDAEDAELMMRELTLHGIDAIKHPLYAIVASTAVAITKLLTGIETRQAVLLVIALFAALNITAMAVLSQQWGHTVLASTIGAACFGLSFAALVILSVPETYAVTVLVLILYLAAFHRFAGHMTVVRAIVLGVLAGLGGLANPPLLMLGIIPAVQLLQTRSVQECVRWSVVMLITSLVVFLSVIMVLWGSRYFSLSTGYAETWASLGNFVDTVALGSAGSQFLLFAIVSPLDHAPILFGADDALQYVQRPLSVLPLMTWLCALFIACRWLWKAGRPEERSLAAWIGVTFIFYIWFNPGEAILYSIQLLPPMILIIQRALQSVAWQRSAGVICAAAIATMAVINVAACFGTEAHL